tara:strand:+ start:1033 stop:1173 length:141 start_codon:yes stop_codon:yes gene_type:complete
MRVKTDTADSSEEEQLEKWKRRAMILFYISLGYTMDNQSITSSIGY